MKVNQLTKEVTLSEYEYHSIVEPHILKEEDKEVINSLVNLIRAKKEESFMTESYDGEEFDEMLSKVKSFVKNRLRLYVISSPTRGGRGLRQ